MSIAGCADGTILVTGSTESTDDDLQDKRKGTSSDYDLWVLKIDPLD